MRFIKKATMGLLTVAMSVAAFSAAASDSDKWATIEKLTISPAQAVGIAATQDHGDVIEMEIDFRDGVPYYEVEVQGDEHKHKLTIDAESGEVISNKVNDGFFKSKEKPKATLVMQKAITIAERETGARVKEAELKTKGDDSYYDIEAVTNKEKYEVKIDAHTGEILKLEKDD
jgi:uncharacterized membrane protein YkoI